MTRLGLLLALTLWSGCTLGASGNIVITNEYKGECYSTQPGRGSREVGYTKMKEPCHNLPSMGMIPLVIFRW